jgi:hypothetical protein
MSTAFDEEFMIKQLMTEVKALHKTLEGVRIDMAALKIKSGIWGLAAGLIPAIGILFMYLIGKF